MSAVNAVQNVAKNGLEAVRSAAKATAPIITADAQRGARKILDGTSGSSSIQRGRSHGCKALQRIDHSARNTFSDAASWQGTAKPNTAHNNYTKPQRPTPLLTFTYEPHPRPINCTTFTPTKTFISDPSHPFHIRAQRRLAAFDPTKLTWRVQVPVAVSKRPALRREAEKRVKNAVRKELREMGYGEDGGRLGVEQAGEAADQSLLAEPESAGISKKEMGRALSGALLMMTNRDPMRSLTFKSEEVREEVRRWVGKVLRERERGGGGNVRGDYNSRQDNVGVKRLSSKDGIMKGRAGSNAGW